MYGINEAVVLGHLGANPEVKTFDDGGKIVTLSVATSDSWTDKSGQKQESTEWHRVVLRGGTANTAERFLKKGSKVYIKGPMKTRKYTDSQGIDRYTTEIVGLSMIMLDGAQGQQQGQGQYNDGFSQDPHQGQPQNQNNNTGFVNNMTNQGRPQNQPPQQNQNNGYNGMDNDIPPFGSN